MDGKEFVGVQGLMVCDAPNDTQECSATFRYKYFH